MTFENRFSARGPAHPRPDPRDDRTAQLTTETTCTRRELRNGLEEITRHHEHSHALVHLGVFPGDGQLSELASEHSTFLLDRRRAWGDIDPGVHEILAQAMTWQALKGRTPEKRRLQAVFRELMVHQPPAYQLPPSALRATLGHVLECVYQVRMWGLKGLPPGVSTGDAIRQLLSVR